MQELRAHPRHMVDLPVLFATPDSQGIGLKQGNLYPTLFMTASTTTADTLLRQAWLPGSPSQAGRLAVRSVDILFQVCLPPSRLRVPVSRGVLAVSSRTVMNNVGYNLSIGGCAVESPTPVTVGEGLALFIHLPDDRSAIKIDRALVRWASRGEFGV